MSLKKTPYVVIRRSIVVAYDAVNVNWEPALLPSMQQVKQAMILLRSEDGNLVFGVDVRHPHSRSLCIEAV